MLKHRNNYRIIDVIRDLWQIDAFGMTHFLKDTIYINMIDVLVGEVCIE